MASNFEVLFLIFSKNLNLLIGMMDFSDLQIGIQFLLGTQLIIVAILHFIYRSSKGTITLAFLCLIFGLWFYKLIFYGAWQNNIFLYILVGPDKPIFIGPLLFFYYRQYSEELKTIFTIKHLIIPVLFYLTLMIFRFHYLDFFPNFINNNIPVFSIIAFLFFCYYFIITRKELEINIKQKLIPRAYKKVNILFYSLYFFLLQAPIWDMYDELVRSGILSEGLTEYVVRLYDNFFKFIGEHLTYIYLHVLAYLLFLYTLSEIPALKGFLLPRNTLVHKKTLLNTTKIDKLVDHYFTNKKIFKHPDLSLEQCAKTFKITKKELIDYFIIKQEGSFKDFINRLRVKEVKMLLERKEFNNYDLVGLAKECGFKSKSTFFRVFKKHAGITPKDYKTLIK